MNDEFEIKDVSDSVKQKDPFIMIILILLIVLVIGFCFIYFFGYEFLKPFIKV